MRDVQPPLRMAQKMGEGVGRGEILLGSVPDDFKEEITP